ncbi:hypothetical protein IX39_20190 [Chryseobacterium formosense]|uniref:Uncharacterized protein n=1 Tax=Chryseobacterium formosense TaxID=236814 RepID=A0A085YYR0_9FLAO|nr:hypothetical protein IX39_20190 [Chryseobacterium formosense]OCK51102.1 hypothetical protein BA768_18230 [Chryseobacterium sp. CBo1]
MCYSKQIAYRIGVVAVSTGIFMVSGLCIGVEVAVVSTVVVVTFIESFSDDIEGSFEPQLVATKPNMKAVNINFFIIFYFYGGINETQLSFQKL